MKIKITESQFNRLSNKNLLFEYEILPYKQTMDLGTRLDYSFNVGDIVGINHKKMDPKQNFRVIKINSKNIKVQASDVADGRIGGMYTVSPSLLVLK